MSILPTREHLRTEHQMLVACEKIILTSVLTVEKEQDLVSHPVNGRCSVINSLSYGDEICETVLNCDIIWCPDPHIEKDNMGHRGELAYRITI